MVWSWTLRSLLFLWELPQNLLGIATLLLNWYLRSIVAVEFDRERVMIETKRRAVSLGLFVFWTRQSHRGSRHDESVHDHEWGHSVQSRMLGPLYLFVVGIPSVLRVAYLVAYRELTGRRWKNYYKGFPENWADRLGGVKRN